ncbi:PREDICTED: serine protease 27-like [Nanorana parkeri]|uniref:serine protease 27-like n=1 Tax=Nanorana parkeri TaxID=125878 RepID=UPI000854205A|nr:PREDICTED: serine protease 27-like [Nanorana parkeri]
MTVRVLPHLSDILVTSEAPNCKYNFRYSSVFHPCRVICFILHSDTIKRLCFPSPLAASCGGGHSISFDSTWSHCDLLTTNTMMHLHLWTLSLLLTTGLHLSSSYSVCTGCGKPMTSDRIVGGQDAFYGEWPWQISLRKNGYHICGGVMIDSQWVLTAAHCFVRPYSPADYMVNLGAYQLSIPSGVMSQVSAINIHPIYQRDGSSGDIALIKLRNSIQYTDYIMPICIPAENVQFPSGINCYVTGWGSMNQGVSLPSPQTLQKVQLPIIEQKECDAMYHINNPTLSPNKTIIQWDMICAGFEKGQKDACQGDSGGPLACKWDGSWLLAGIVSWGFGCALANRPGVYTRVTSYSSWIQQYVPNFQVTPAVITPLDPTNGSICPSSCLTLLLFLYTLLLHRLM